MECPQCGHQNDADVKICTACDFIMDKSFLGKGYTDSSPGEQPQAPDPDPSISRPKSDSLTGASLGKKSSSRPSSRRRNSGSKAKTVQSSPPPESAPAADSPNAAMEVEVTLKRIWSFFLGLRKFDQLTQGGAIAMFIFVFLPWLRVSPIDIRSGFEWDGWLVALLAVACCVLLYLRQKTKSPEQLKLLVWGQMGCSALVLLFLLSKVFSSRPWSSLDSRVVAVQDLMPPSVMAGLMLCFLAALIVAVGTAWMYRDYSRN